MKIIVVILLMCISVFAIDTLRYPKTYADGYRLKARDLNRDNDTTRMKINALIDTVENNFVRNNATGETILGISLGSADISYLADTLIFPGHLIAGTLATTNLSGTLLETSGIVDFVSFGFALDTIIYINDTVDSLILPDLYTGKSFAIPER